MALMQITEYSASGNEINGIRIPVVQEPAVAYQQITTSGTAAQSAAFHADTRFVRLSFDAAHRIRFGANPTALATDTRMVADAAEYFGVKPGDKVSAITG